MMSNTYERQRDLAVLLPKGYCTSFVEVARRCRFVAIFQTRENIAGLERKLEIASDIISNSFTAYRDRVSLKYRRDLHTAIEGEKRILEALEEYHSVPAIQSKTRDACNALAAS